MSQFSADDERAGHRQMLNRIRAEQVKDEPEPDHEPSWVEDYVMCEPDPIRHWCCDWHRYHADDEPDCETCGEQVADADHHTCARPQGAN